MFSEVSRPLLQSDRRPQRNVREPALAIYLAESGFPYDILAPMLCRHARRVFGVFRHPGQDGRMNQHCDVFVPSAWFFEVGDQSYLVSLRIALPVALSRRYLSITPLNVRDEDMDHRRDLARNRGRMVF